MIIPLIPKNTDLNDFTCRDGETDIYEAVSSRPSESAPSGAGSPVSVGLQPAGALEALMEATLRIPLQGGDRGKAELLLGGQASRVDPATADRLTQAIVEKAAECLLDLSTDLRRQGLFILPFRFFTMTQLPDGTLSFPSPQGVALPTDRPPHPEITAAAATDDALTLALRFPVKPHRLTVTASTALPAGYSLRTFISYPLYIPDPKEMRGSIGSVRSAAGDNATGIRFAFLSSSAVKASVAAPEKYHELVGNRRTGYRLSSKATPVPDYSSHAAVYGYVPPFPRASLLALGEEVDPATDPLDWIADWEEAADPADAEREGYLPVALPYVWRRPGGGGADTAGGAVWPEGIDREAALEEARAVGAGALLLTRPMTFAADSVSRRHAAARGIAALRVLGMDSAPSFAILYGSDDGIRWEALRRFDPRVRVTLLTPRRLFWRLLLAVRRPSPHALALTLAP